MFELFVSRSACCGGRRFATTAEAKQLARPERAVAAPDLQMNEQLT
jgi:hypothetical protein